MKTLTSLILFISFCTFSQEENNFIAKDSIQSTNKKVNPIIFGSFDLAFGNGIMIGGGLNYQREEHLFSFRVMQYQQLRNDGYFIIIPFFTIIRSTQEFGLLYGKRWAEGGQAFAVSGGLSFNQNIDYARFDGIDKHFNSIGFPFEASVHWFKSKKQPFRIVYGLIPVGPPTTIGRSFGFKIIGNLSKQSYLGIGFTFGLGVHKVYD